MWRDLTGRKDRQLETALRAQRAEPSRDFVRKVARQLHAEAPRRLAWSRLAFAGAVATFVLGSLASFGGFGYAATGADNAYRVVKQAVVDKKVTVDIRKSAASAQYNNPGTETGGTNNNVQAAGVQQAGSLGSSASGNLPFTGVSLLTTAAVGVALILAGLILRRRERRN